MARDHRLQPTFSHPAATSINHHNRIPSFHVNRLKKQANACKVMSCPLSTRCAPTPAPTFLDSVQCWRYGDTSPLDGPSVAPGKLPTAPLFVPARWLELPSVFGQIHPKETPDACCRVPCGFRRAKQNKPILILPQKSFEVSFLMLDPERRPSTKLICEQNQHKIHKTGSKHTAPWALNGMVSSCCSVRSCIFPPVQVDGKAEDVVDFPRCDLQPFPSPTVPAAAP